MITFPAGRDLALRLGLIAVLLILPTCGAGSGGGQGPDGAGQGLILLKFMQANTSTVPINQQLEFRFSEAVDPATINVATLQIREGPGYGISVAGEFTTDGSVVFFSPVLPTLCDKSDAGLRPGTTYRVIILGAPEEFSVKNSVGQTLDQTSTHEFRTLPDGDPDHLHDQIPGVSPSVKSTEPTPGTAAVGATAGGQIVVEFTENLDPCTLRLGDTVVARIFELGDPLVFLEAPNGNESGFVPVEDAAPDDPYTWGGNGTPLSPAPTLNVAMSLEQTFERTAVTLTPLSGAFPENALIAVDLTVGIRDFGGSPLEPETLSFTTENLARGERSLRIEYDDTTPIDGAVTSADVNTARSPSRAQAWMSFGADGDNGTQPITLPAWPILNPGTFAVEDCSQSQPNSDSPTTFAPTTDITLNTGSELIDPAQCENPSDASTAALWEFESVHIPDGVTVTIIGENPAMFLVQGEFRVDLLGAIVVKGGDGSPGVTTPSSSTIQNTPGGVPGGTGRAGGGDGGWSYDSTHNKSYGDSGVTDFDSTIGPYLEGGVTAGQGGVGQLCSPGSFSCPQAFGAAGQGGGGGGHATAGTDGLLLPNQTGSTYSTVAPPGGVGGVAYGDDHLRAPSAGAGGGGGGHSYCGAGSAGAARYGQEGGGAGAGGGYFGVVAAGNIVVNGTIDASGGKGGTSGAGVYSCGGGGGGGAGGSILLLTTTDISLLNATIKASGGLGGVGYRQTACSSGGGVTANLVPWNNGGKGGDGRIVLEDADSTLSGQPATLDPDDAPGFYLGPFDPTRFVGGGIGGSSLAATQAIGLGGVLLPANVDFESLEETDFVAGIPSAASLATDASMVVEMQGFLALPSGGPDLTTGTGWYAVGYFNDRGIPTEPRWIPDVAPPGFVTDAGENINSLDGRAAYVQVRTTFFLPEGMDAEQPGPYIDSMLIRFENDN